jgi:hypothetical protein
MSGQAKSGGPAVRLAIAAGIGASVTGLVVALLNALVPASGYLHPGQGPASHLWMGLVAGLGSTTAIALVMLDEGRLGRGSRPLLAFLVALQIWPLALLAASRSARASRRPVGRGRDIDPRLRRRSACCGWDG